MGSEGIEPLSQWQVLYRHPDVPASRFASRGLHVVSSPRVRRGGRRASRTPCPVGHALLSREAPHHADSSSGRPGLETGLRGRRRTRTPAAMRPHRFRGGPGAGRQFVFQECATRGARPERAAGAARRRAEDSNPGRGATASPSKRARHLVGSPSGSGRVTSVPATAARAARHGSTLQAAASSLKKART